MDRITCVKSAEMAKEPLAAPARPTRLCGQRIWRIGSCWVKALRNIAASGSGLLADRAQLRRTGIAETLKISFTRAEIRLLIDLIGEKQEDKSYYGNKEQYYKRLESIAAKIVWAFEYGS